MSLNYLKLSIKYDFEVLHVIDLVQEEFQKMKHTINEKQVKLNFIDELFLYGKDILSHIKSGTRDMVTLSEKLNLSLPKTIWLCGRLMALGVIVFASK